MWCAIDILCMVDAMDTLANTEGDLQSGDQHAMIDDIGHVWSQRPVAGQ